MRSAEYQRTKPKRHLAQVREARGQCRIDPAGSGADDQPGRGDCELHGDVFVGPDTESRKAACDVPARHAVRMRVEKRAQVGLIAESFQPSHYSATLS